MISIRRLIASMLAGALLVLVSAAQASAQPAPNFDRAVEGVALGLTAASELAGDGDTIVVDEGLIEALGVYDAWVAKHENSNRQGEGQGPANAQEVHEALLEREVPGQLKKDTGSKLSELSSLYETLKGKSDEAKAAKDAKDKSNNGKSDDKSNNGKSDDKSNNGKSDDKSNNGKSDDNSSDDESSTETSKGQPNRP